MLVCWCAAVSCRAADPSGSAACALSLADISVAESSVACAVTSPPAAVTSASAGSAFSSSSRATLPNLSLPPDVMPKPPTFDQLTIGGLEHDRGDDSVDQAMAHGMVDW